MTGTPTRFAVRRSRALRAKMLGCTSPLNDCLLARRALAPLELVLNLFFLLALMALIINFGVLGPWHVRGKLAARYAVWRSLSIRTGGNDAMPSNWWQPATMGLSAPMSLNSLPYDMVGQTWNQGDLAQSALRGPAIVDPATGSSIRMNNQRYFEMVDRAQIGSAYLQKTLPLLPNLRKAQINPMQPVFDSFWRFQDMSAQSGGVAMRFNGDWRAFKWYQFLPADLGNGDLMNLFMQFQMADMKIQQNPGAQALLVLDRDSEFVQWGVTSPDAYSYAASMSGIIGQCEASPENVAQNWIQGPNGLIRWIQGPTAGGGQNAIPQWLAQRFIDLYNQEIRYYQSQNPPNQAQIDRLQGLIQQLQQFIATLN